MVILVFWKGNNNSEKTLGRWNKEAGPKNYKNLQTKDYF
jgi:hypothetical protein